MYRAKVRIGARGIESKVEMKGGLVFIAIPYAVGSTAPRTAAAGCGMLDRGGGPDPPDRITNVDRLAGRHEGYRIVRSNLDCKSRSGKELVVGSGTALPGE